MRIFPAVLLVLAVCLSGWAVSKEYLTTRSLTPSSVTVTGNSDHSGWLGITVYSVNDRVPNQSQVTFVRQGSWTQSFALSGSCANSKYDVALWETKVPRSQCKTADCKWCRANGFHMEGLRTLTSGQVAP